MLSKHMELRQLHYFRIIAEEEHFGRASTRLRIAQPALSRQMRLLEAEIGVELFQRLPRGVRLNAAGAVLLDHCRALSVSLERAVAQTRAAAAGTAGTLRLGFVEIAAWGGIVPESIRQFRLEAPEVVLSLSSLSSVAQIEALREGTLDGGLLYGQLDDREFTCLPLVRHAIVLAAPRDSEFSERSSVRLAELAGYDFVSFQRKASPRYHDELTKALAAQGFKPNIVAEMSAEADMLALVHAGVGLAFVNACQRWRPSEGLSFLTIDDLDVALELMLVHRRDSAPPPLGRYIGLVSRLGGEK
jgi:DNA-binding transcriptional LysR family regulator